MHATKLFAVRAQTSRIVLQQKFDNMILVGTLINLQPAKKAIATDDNLGNADLGVYLSKGFLEVLQ
jgi:hypothetical protein